MSLGLPSPMRLREIQREIENMRCREDIPEQVFSNLSDASAAIGDAIDWLEDEDAP